MDKPEILEACQRIAEDHLSAALFELPPPAGPSRGLAMPSRKSAAWLARLP